MGSAAQSLDHQIIDQLIPLAVAIDSIHHDPNNAKIHGEENIPALAASLKKFGQRKPVVVKKNGRMIEAGHGTHLAAKSLGWKSIAAVFVDDADDVATAYAVADNRTAELSLWDYEKLALQISEIEDEALRAATGFTEDEISGLDWETDIEAARQSVNDTTANLDGIAVAIIITVPQELAPAVKSEINALIRSRGTAWEKVAIA